MMKCEQLEIKGQGFYISKFAGRQVSQMAAAFVQNGQGVLHSAVSSSTRYVIVDNTKSAKEKSQLKLDFDKTLFILKAVGSVVFINMENFVQLRD